METEHTLGPWYIRGTTNDSESVVTGSANGLWATVEGPNDETRLANARLIAAAPCLLAALQRLVHPMADDDDLENALEVIARATGAA
jgi:hypothetical protein